MRSAVLITGASRGFGRCLALDMARETLSGDLDLFLWARQLDGLQETERLVHEAWTTRCDAASVGKLQVLLTVVNLSDKLDYIPQINAALAQLKTGHYNTIYLVHNAGSLGELTYTQEWSSSEMLEQYWHLNVHHVVWFNKRFLDEFGATRVELERRPKPPVPGTSSTSSSDGAPQCVIVNITSRSALTSFETYGLYCTGKAARDMHHRVVAKEQAPVRKVRVLQYSPGPMDTDMQVQVRESTGVFQELGSKFRAMKADGMLILPETSSRRCIQCLLQGAFETGAFVDYNDLAPKEQA